MGKKGLPIGGGVVGIFGTTIKCDATDTSFYCTIMKLFNLLIVLLIFIYVLYFIYTFIIEPYFLKRGKRGR